MGYDIYLFIEIIESIQGITFLRQGEVEGISIRYYQGLKGNLVMIDMSEEFITPLTGKGHLINLGLADLIPAIFPDKKE